MPEAPVAYVQYVARRMEIGVQPLKLGRLKSLAKKCVDFVLIGVGFKRIGKSTRLGRVRIPYNTLIEKIQEYSKTYQYEVRGWTRHHYFDSLGDIKKNSELICGQPMFFIGPVDVFFGTNDTVVTVLKPDDENAKQLYNRLVAFLKVRHSRVSQIFCSMWMICVFGVVSLYAIWFKVDIVSSLPTPFLFAYSFAFLIFAMSAISNSIFRQRVLPDGYTQFLSGKRGDIVVAIITAAVTSILFPVIKRYLES